MLATSVAEQREMGAAYYSNAVPYEVLETDEEVAEVAANKVAKLWSVEESVM